MTKSVTSNAGDLPAFKIQLTLWLISGLSMLSGTIISASLPGISAHFLPHANGGDILSRLILTMPAITVAVIAPIAGLFISKIGCLKPLFVGLILFAISGANGLFSDSIWTILAGRVVLGVSISIILTVGTVLIGDYVHGELARQKFMSVQGTFVTLCGAFFLAAGGFLCEINWRIPFGIYFVSLLIIPMVALWFHEPESNAAPKDASKDETGYFGPGGYLTALPVFCSAFATLAIFFIVPTQLPFVVQSMGGSGADAGMVMGVGPLVSAFTSLFYVKLRKYLNIRNVFVFVCIVQGIGLGAVGFASHLWQLYFPFIFLGIGNGFAFSNTSVWFLQIVAPAKRAKLSGILTGSFFLGQFCSPLFIQPFLDILHMPLNHVFTLYGGVLLVIAVLLFLFKPRLGNEANA